MGDLPAVNDDHSNIRQTIEMMNIPDQNVFELRNGSRKQIEDLYKQVF